MSMTENEAINVLQLNKPFTASKEANNAIEMAIQALEEIQQYRAIGTVEEFKVFKLGRLGNKGFITIGQTMEEYAQAIRAKTIDDVMKKAEELQKDQIKNLENSSMRNGKRWGVYMNTYLGHIQTACKRLIREQLQGVKGEENES